MIALAACIAILATGCYGPIGWNNEWPLIRALPTSWKRHIYPSRIDDPFVAAEVGTADVETAKVENARVDTTEPDKPFADPFQARRPLLRRWSSLPSPRSSGTLVPK